MSEQPSKLGYLLINLGTPDSPDVKDVRRYLGEFDGPPRARRTLGNQSTHR